MDRFEVQLRRLRGLFSVFLAPEVTEALLSLGRPALRLGPDGGVDGGATVRLGGAPLLPLGEPWPTWSGRPLDCLGVVDFAGLPEVPGLPMDGRYAFYYASDLPRPWGDAPGQRGAWRVFTGDLREAEAPTGVVPFPQCVLKATKFLSLPSPLEPLLQRLEGMYSGVLAVYEQLYAAWQAHVWPDDAPVHQLGGWPALVQRPVALDCHNASTGCNADAPPLSRDELTAVADEWHLLLQLDSDEHLGWHWGEPGRIYFCTHKNNPVEATWLTLQAKA